MSFSHRSITSTLLATAVLAACSDSTTDPDPDPECTVSAVAITGAPGELQVPGTIQLAANVTQQNCTPAPTIAWQSSNNSRATVSSTGLVTAVATGEVTITASAGGKSGTANILITPAPTVASVQVRPDSIVIGVGPAHTLVASAFDDEDNEILGQTFTWLSLDPGTATISASGQLTGVTAGTSGTVTATTGAVTGQAQVHVTRSRLSFFWNDFANPVGEEFPDAFYQYRTLGGPPTVSRQGTGNYTASFPGSAAALYETEAYFVTPYSGPDGAYCRIGSWNSVSTTLTCLDVTGAATDMSWTVAMIGSGSLSGRWGYAWSQSAGANGPAHTSYRYNASGGDITLNRTGPGAYTVRFEGLGRKSASDREAVMVSAYGTGSTSDCIPASWTTVGADLDIEVRCVTPTGEPEDSRFTILVVDGARAGANLAFATTDQPAAAAHAPVNAAVKGVGGGGSVNVTRTETGVYEVNFTGFYRPAGLSETYLITATGPGFHRCQNTGWGTTSTPGGVAEIGVSCTNATGAAADTPFVIIGLQ